MDIQKELNYIKRGVVDILPNEEALFKKLEKSHRDNKPLRVKLGIDPTGTTIHFGHTIPLIKLNQFQELGHHTILILGTFTALVGDPEGRNTTRPQLTQEEVLENAKPMFEQVQKIIDVQRTEIVRNGDWLGKMNIQDAIELGSKVTIAKLLERKDFAKRYQEGISIHIHEMMYPLLMGHDSVHLKADIELGGTEQVLNIYMGRYLQEVGGQDPQVGIILPMLEGLDGVQKMSKSLGNYIGLDESPSDMFRKMTQIPDHQIIPYYTLLTKIPEDEIKKREIRLSNGSLSLKDAKIQLAYEIVRIFHSENDAKKCIENS